MTSRKESLLPPSMKIGLVREAVEKLNSQGLGLPLAVKPWKGKLFLPIDEEPSLGFEASTSAFSGASHPPEPIDIDAMKTMYLPLSQKLPEKPNEVEEKDCVWDASQPASENVSPMSSIGSAGVFTAMSVVHSCASVYSRDGIKGSIGDSMESAKTSVSSTCLSDDSNWSNLTSNASKPHKGNDPRWKAIIAIKTRDGTIGMSNFRLLKLLGSGDIGSVYLSELNGSHCYFAMKVMDKASLASRKKLIRSQTERDILQLLDHPFLPTLYTYFETDRFSCLVMEYCPGGDLHALRQRQPGKHFSEYAARFYAAEVLLALEYLHMLGVVYRDLKPENVLVRDDGHIMLSDFDLSLQCTVSPTLVRNPNDPTINKHRISCVEPVTSSCLQPSCIFPLLSMKRPTTRSHKPPLFSKALPELIAEPTAARSMSFVGTHEYLAPEIIKGEGHGSAVDWWTFGIFLHELIYGTTPFKGSGNRATLFNVVGQQLKFPDSSPPMSHACRDLIRALLVKEPNQRLGTKRGATDIKQHPFFEGVNWALIRCSTPPEVPRHVDFEMFGKVTARYDPVSVSETSRNASTDGKYLDFEFF